MSARKIDRVSGKILGILLTGILVIVIAPTSWAQEKIQRTMLASQIVDQDVLNEKGEKIGEIDDLVIKRSGRVKRVVIETGGFLDIGDKLVALSVGQLKIQNDKKIVSDIPQSELEKQQVFDYFRRGLRPDYYYTPPPAPPLYGYDYGPRHYGDYRPYPRQGEGEVPWLARWAFYPARFLASVVTDRAVINYDFEILGTVQDLVINLDNREVTKIVLASEDILGEGVYVTTRYEPLGFTPYGLMCDISREELKQFPKHTD